MRQGKQFTTDAGKIVWLDKREGGERNAEIVLYKQDKYSTMQDAGLGTERFGHAHQSGKYVRGGGRSRIPPARF